MSMPERSSGVDRLDGGHRDRGRTGVVMKHVDAKQEYLDAAKEAALRAAAVLDEWRHRFRVAEKGRFDLVTDADLASQQTIQAYLLGRFPDHGFLGEEAGASQARPD